METTVGQILVNENLPEDMRDYSRPLNKGTVQKLFSDLADRYPDKYSEISQHFHTLAQAAVTSYGREASLSLNSFRTPEKVKAIHAELTKKIQTVLDSPGKREEKDAKIIELTSSYIDKVTDTNYEEGLKENNPLALQVLSGSRGNKNQFRSLRGGDMLMVDHKERPIPIPVMASYSDGLDPVQYWAGAYGARKGAVSTKFATPKSGFLGKQLVLASHKLMVTEKDCGTTNGIPVEAQDADNEGAVLARGVGDFEPGTVLDPKILKKMGSKPILVRSPMTCQAEQGVCQKCAGVRERGGFPPIGDNIGIAAAQAISEPIGQGQLSAKHTGGQAGSGAKIKSGLDLVNQLVQVPKTFQGAAAISTVDGSVDSIENAPQGGLYVTVGGAQHWVPAGEELKVKKGEKVEAGDVLSSGIPNPSEIVQHKGIGEGRRYFMEQFHQTLSDNKFPAHRRNVELLARGLINHVRISDLDGPADTLPDDVVEYDDIVRKYEPRFGFKTLAPKRSVGLYLEKPILHYSIGTRITPKVAKTLDSHGVADVQAHADTPSFAPEMTRAMETLSHSPDWMVRMGGFHLKKGLTEAVHRSRASDAHSTSFIPALAQGTEFGSAPQGAGY